MANKVKHYVPETFLSHPLVVLRKVDTEKLGGTWDYLGNEVAVWGGDDNTVRARELIWFPDGYIINDTPRESMAVGEILDATLGFAVARSDTGQILKTFPAGKEGLKAAEKAIGGARVELNIDVQMQEDEEPPAEFLESLPTPVEKVDSAEQPSAW